MSHSTIQPPRAQRRVPIFGYPRRAATIPPDLLLLGVAPIALSMLALGLGGGTPVILAGCVATPLAAAISLHQFLRSPLGGRR